MSMVDETPSYYIEKGWIYHYTPGEVIMSGGFDIGPSSKREPLTEATPEEVNKLLADGKHIYNYDTNSWQREIKGEGNLKDILKYAKPGLKLYSLCYGEMTLHNADKMEFLDVASCKHKFFDDGRICNHGEVMLFPNKNRHTWHAWQHYLFRTGDYITNTKSKETFFIIDDKENQVISDTGETSFEYMLSEFRWATKKEIDDFTEKLKSVGFVIKDDEMKVLAEEPLFKVGQMITSKDGRGIWHARIKEVNETSYYCDIDGGTATISFSAQDKYELVNET